MLPHTIGKHMKILKILDNSFFEINKKIIKPSFQLHKGKNKGEHGFLFHFFIKKEFLKYLKIDTYKNIYLSLDKTIFLEFDDCFIEIPKIAPAIEKYILEYSATIIFFKTCSGSKEFFGSLNT